MSPRTRFRLLLSAMLFPGAFLFAAGFYWLRPAIPSDAHMPLLLFFLAAWIVLSLLSGIPWVLLDKTLPRPPQNPDKSMELIKPADSVHELKLPAVVNELGERGTQHETARMLDEETRAEQKQSIDEGASDGTYQRQYEQILVKLLKSLRRPLANLRATAEVLDTYPQMEKTVRRNFYRIILEELRNLDGQTAEAWQARADLSKRRLHMRDISAAALLHELCVHAGKTYILQNHCQEPAPRLHVDSHNFLLLLEYLLCRIKQQVQAREFQTACAAEDGHVYMDISWHGEMLSNSLLEQWLDNAIDACPPVAVMPRDILEAHDCDVWSASTSRADFACLRLSLPPAHPQEADVV